MFPYLFLLFYVLSFEIFLIISNKQRFTINIRKNIFLNSRWRRLIKKDTDQTFQEFVKLMKKMKSFLKI